MAKKAPDAQRPMVVPTRKHGLMYFLQSRHILRNWDLYLLLVPVIIYYIVFHFRPIYGLQLAFKTYDASLGITASPWKGFGHLQRFFQSPYFGRLLRNTVAISLLQLLFGFPIPILLALMVNEVSNRGAKKFVQNATYIPYFLSTVVVVGMLKNFAHYEYGIVNVIIKLLGGDAIDFMQEASWFRPLYVISGVWQSAGWNSIIYVAALAGVDPQLHEAAKIDGASRLQRVWHINLPSIMPTIMVLLILNVGQIMNVGFEKAFLMQNNLNMETADIIATYAYRTGIQGAQYEFSTAISLFNSVINFALLVSINAISRKLSETSLW